jgi:uroporphyrinogen decarboxylase
MTNEQWQRLIAVVEGASIDPLPVGFIIDSPWLPGWAGATILDYYTSGDAWFETNMKAIRQWPEAMFLPGFWSEYGMCTEPSAFGARTVWFEDEFPFADKIIDDPSQAASIAKPEVDRAGLLPFVLKRLHHYQTRIESAGHAIRFAVARGPLNIATFLMGTTEFLMAIKTHPDAMHQLLQTITDFLRDWLQLQARTFPTIDGVLVLDDPVGFLGKDDFEEFALPYLKRSFNAIDARIRFYHNDAKGQVCAPYLPKIGVNLFNHGFEHSLAEMKRWTQNKVTLLGNIPPRDVLAGGSPGEVQAAVHASLNGVEDTSRIILSCGGGMPPDVPTANIDAFLQAAGHRA